MPGPAGQPQITWGHEQGNGPLLTAMSCGLKADGRSDLLSCSLELRRKKLAAEAPVRC
jgi:hypothetical protein